MDEHHTQRAMDGIGQDESRDSEGGPTHVHINPVDAHDKSKGFEDDRSWCLWVAVSETSLAPGANPAGLAAKPAPLFYGSRACISRRVHLMNRSLLGTRLKQPRRLLGD